MRHRSLCTGSSCSLKEEKINNHVKKLALVLKKSRNDRKLKTVEAAEGCWLIFSVLLSIIFREMKRSLKRRRRIEKC